VKTNQAGTIFGARTAGLGGSVEEVTVTPYAQASLSLTRSLFAPMTAQSQVPFGGLTEDEGVAPDVAYTPTVADFRSGYLGYVRAFSDTAIAAVR
jgi:C-terminal processing protease CtpA/Prc